MAPKVTLPASSSSDAAASNGARRLKGKRTRTGCLTCRVRKVKCDETPGTCANCERVCLECRWPVVRNVLDDRGSPPKAELSPQLPPSSGPIRRNRHGACLACRGTRARCSQDRPACSRCVEIGVHCDYGSTSLATPSSVEESPGGAESDIWRGPQIHGLPRALVDRHLEAYFAHVYPVQGNAIVHRGTLLRDITDGRAPRKVVLALCAVASRFVEVPTTPGDIAPPPMLRGSPDAQRWANEAKGYLLTDDMSLDNITTALILAKNDIQSGRFGQAFVLAALAIRMSLALGLHRELPPEDKTSITERETRRRLMWGCYSLDRTMSTGVPEFLCTPASRLQIRLPCDDQQYSFGMRTDTPIPPLEAENGEEGDMSLYKDIGMFGQHIRLLSIRALILRVVRNRAPEDLPPWDPNSNFAHAERRLTEWYATLSPQFQLEPETIYARQFQNELTPLTMLHVWYHQNFVELTRIAMPGFSESLSPDMMARAPQAWVDHVRDLAASHARMTARTLVHIANLIDMDALVFGDPSLPICVYESARVRLQYAFLMPAEVQPSEQTELITDVAAMAMFLERMGRHFKNARWLLREMRKMLRRHGLDPGNEVSEGSAPGSPAAQDPWTRRVRTMRDNVPRRPPPPLPPQSHSYPPMHNHSMDPRGYHPSSHTSLSSAASQPMQHIPSQILTPTMPLYSEPQGVTQWTTPSDASGSGLGISAHDDVSVLLDELGQAPNGMGNANPFLGMFADWVATGYDASMALHGVV